MLEFKVFPKIDFRFLKTWLCKCDFLLIKSDISKDQNRCTEALLLNAEIFSAFLKNLKQSMSLMFY